MWRYRGRLWVDLLVVASVGTVAWFWWQGTRVAPEEIAMQLPQVVVENAEERPELPPVAVPVPSPLAEQAITPQGEPETQRVAKDEPSRLQLRDVRVLSEPRQFRLIVEHDGPEIEANFYYLASPPRMVLDMPGAWQLSARQLAPKRSSGDLVEQVRLGDRAGELRVVLDLRDSQEPATRLRQEPGRLELRLNRGR